MSNDIKYEQGNYGLRIVLRAPWSPSMLHELQRLSVKELELNSGKGWRGQDISFISNFPHLKRLCILDLALADVEPIHDLRELESLQLSAYFRTRLRLSEFPMLRECSLEWGKGAESLFKCEKLERLFLNRYPRDTLKPILRLSKLRYLALLSSPISSLNCIGQLSKLEELRLALLRKLASLDGVERLTQLRVLDVATCRKIDDVRSVGQLSNLEVLRLDNCGEIDSLRPLEDLTKLRSLSFAATTKIRDGDLSVLRRLLSLEYVAFQDRPHYTHRREHLADPLTGRTDIDTRSA